MARNRSQKRTKTSSGPLWLWLVAIGLVAIGGVLAFFSLTSSQPQTAGALTVQSTSHNFGKVRMGDGLISTRFPITVQSPVVVASIQTSWMCTNARLVQAEKASNWFGMAMEGEPLPAANLQLVPDASAYLEVVIDPAAHGDAGIGPLQRAVLLQTADGNHIQFDLTAEITR